MSRLAQGFDLGLIRSGLIHHYTKNNDKCQQDVCEIFNIRLTLPIAKIRPTNIRYKIYDGLGRWT